MIESRGIHEEFLDYSDAAPVLEKRLFEEAQQGWELQDGSGLRYEDGKWIIGLGFRRYNRPENDELDLFEKRIQDGKETTVREGTDVSIISESGTGEGLRTGDEESVSTGGYEPEV